MAETIIYSGRDLVAFSHLRSLATRGVFKLADWLGFWRYPASFDIEDLESFWRMTYWFYIAERPVIRAEKGSRLEAFFESQQSIKPALPHNFQSKTSITLSAVGDLMCNRALENSADRYYEQVADLIFPADVSFANLESSLTSGLIDEPSLSVGKLPKINASSAQYEVIKGYQQKHYRVFQTANNHMLDCGLDGILTTHRQLVSDGIPYVGTNESTEGQKKGLILDVKGIRLGFVAATWGVNNRPFPEGKNYLVNVVHFHKHKGEVDLSLLEEQMTWCRQQGCDLVIAGLHWGCEWEFFPRVYQLEQAHRLAEAGADVIIGHHAHVIQPIEWYRTKRDPDRLVPIFYNLGNLVAIVTAPFSALSLVARLTLTKGQVNGEDKTLVESEQLTPVIQLSQEKNGKQTVWLESFQRLLGKKTESPFREHIEKAAKYADLVLGHGWQIEI